MRKWALLRIELTRSGKSPMYKADSVLSNDPEVIVFNLKKRYTGVSATINALVPLQAKQWRLGFCGTRMSNGIEGMTLVQAIELSRKPPVGRAFRIWHVRRDPEMMAAIFARDVLRLPIKLVFTSAAQHLHGWFPRWLISKMDAVISTTPLAARFVPNTTAVVPHGIDLSRFSPPPDKLNAWVDSGLPGQYGIGVFGRVRPDKGSDIFVHAMIQALPQLPGATAVIAGLAQPQHQAFQQDLQRQIDAAGLHDRIVFLGEVPAGEMHLWYQRCLLCVACPRYEPFGLTPFEAAATACALVCSRTGAFDQLAIPGQTGEMVDVEDVPGLTEAVLSVLKNSNHAVKMGEAARARVSALFSLAREAEGIAHVYSGLFEKARAG
jgi:mannosyltransferase